MTPTRLLEVVSVAVTVVAAVPAFQHVHGLLRERHARRRGEREARDARFYAAQAAQFEAAWPEVLRDLRIITTTGAAP